MDEAGHGEPRLMLVRITAVTKINFFLLEKKREKKKNAGKDPKLDDGSILCSLRCIGKTCIWLHILKSRLSKNRGTADDLRVYQNDGFLERKTSIHRTSNFYSYGYQAQLIRLITAATANCCLVQNRKHIAPSIPRYRLVETHRPGHELRP